MDVDEGADHAVEAPATHAQKLAPALGALLRLLDRTTHASLDSAVIELSLRRRRVRTSYSCRLTLPLHAVMHREMGLHGFCSALTSDDDANVVVTGPAEHVKLAVVGQPTAVRRQ